QVGEQERKHSVATHQLQQSQTQLKQLESKCNQCKVELPLLEKQLSELKKQIGDITARFSMSMDQWSDMLLGKSKRGTTSADSKTPIVEEKKEQKKKQQKPCWMYVECQYPGTFH